MLRLKRWLAPPVFKDEEKTHQAYLLHIILLAIIAIPIPFVVYQLLQKPEEAGRALGIISLAEIINVILFFMLKRGYVHQASIVHVFTLWLIFAASSVTSSGIYGVAYMLGNTLVITIAGILLGGRGALTMTLAAVILGGAMVYAEMRGWVPPDILDDPLSTWTVIVVLFAIVMSLQTLSTNEVRAMNKRARASEQRYRLISQVSSDYTFSTKVDSSDKMSLSWVAGAFEGITGYTYEDYLANGGWHAHLHPEDVEKDAQHTAILKTNKPVSMEVRTYKKNGDLSWVRVYAHPVWDDKQNRLTDIVGAVQDITGQKIIEQHERNRREILEKMLELGKRVTEVHDLKTTLEQIWHAVRDDLGFDRTGIFFYNAERNSMDRVLGTDKYGNMSNSLNVWFYIDDQSLFKLVLEKPDGLYVTSNFDIENNIPENHEMYGIKGYAAVAVWAGKKQVAVISVDQFITQRPITDQQLEALRLFAGYAGLAIENSRLKEAIQNELMEQKQAEEKEQRRRIMLEKVVQLGKQVTEVSDLRTTLKKIWHGVRYDLDFDRVGLFTYDPQENIMQGAYGTDRQGVLWDAWHVKFGLDENSLFYKVLSRPDGLFFTEDYEREFNLPPDHDMIGVKYCAMVAVWAGNKPVAIISVDQLITNRPILEEQQEALRLFAGYAGLAISNAYLNDALEDELAQKQTFIDELEAKNAELERFTYTVSHDLKSPLVTITGFLGYLEKDALTGNKEKIRNSISRISNAAEKMQELLNDLLELSRIGRLMNPPEDIPFEEIVKEAVEHVQGRLDEKNVLLNIQKDLPTIHGDRARLVEVMQNLIDNAAKYSNPDVRSMIEIGTTTDPKNNTVYFVRDNGIGIESQFHERVFGLFNKLNPHSEGTGIGLALVKRIIEVHNGQIWVESEEGKGATFYFILPKA